MNWSSHQERIYDFGAVGAGNLLIEAVAGSGKSTTLKELVRRLPATSSILVLAFNRHIRDPLEADLEDLYNVRVQTLNGFGNGAVRRALGRVKLNSDKTSNVLRYQILNGADSEEDRALYYSTVSAISKLVALRKHLLLPTLTLESLVELMDNFDIDLPRATSEGELLYLLEATWKACLEETKTIDFDDQLFFPIHFNYSLEQFDFLLVDEAQDLSPVQIELTKRALRPTGRAFYCGDRKQAIYQFRGADSRAMQRIEEELSCATLPLSICYRCATSIVELAREIVPQIEAAPQAPLGLVETVESDDFLPEAGDFILCRTTAPLVPECLKMIRQGRKATIKGRDIGVALAVFIKKAKAGAAAPIEEFLEALQDYYEKERSKLVSSRREAALQTLEDKYDTILALSDGPEIRSLSNLLTSIEQIFSDSVSGVLFSTIHKAKGLEAERVWILRPDLMPHPKSRDVQAELNIRYVAVTRAKRELRFVSSAVPLTAQNAPQEEVVCAK